MDRRPNHRLSSRLALLALLVAPAARADLRAWDGSWMNTTFGSTGRAYFLLDVQGADARLYMDLDGNVFGGSNPAPVNITGTVDGNGDIVLSGSNPPLYTSISGTISDEGVVSVDLLGAGGVFPRVEVRGTWSADLIDVDYTVFSGGGSTVFAVGTISSPGDCIADLVPTGTLNVDDVQAFVTQFTNGQADLTLDGAVNVDDIQAFVCSFLEGCP